MEDDGYNSYKDEAGYWEASDFYYGWLGELIKVEQQ